jgi:hypothetical protein
MAEKNLAKLLLNMNPELHAGEYVFCSLPESKFKLLSINPVCMFREVEGISIIVSQSDADALGLTYEGSWSLITCNVTSDLASVGFLARMSTALAQAGISANAVSAYFHDHLFVPKEKANEALAILQKLSFDLRIE